MSISSLKIVQLNMSRASAVSDQLLAYCQEEGVDIALVQEPYTNRGKLSGFEVAPIRCYLSKGSRRRGAPKYRDYGAAIIVFNQDLVVAARDVEATENFVSIDLDCGDDGLVTLISGYFKYRVPTAIHVAALELLISNITDKVLISLDANAFHKRWFSRISDARGEALAMFIDAHALEIANVRSPHTTFHGPRGRTNIDVTLVDRSTRSKLTGWSIEPGATSSDHQLLRFSVELKRRIFIHKESRFVLQKCNYARLRQAYEALDELRASEHPDLDRFARDIEDDVSAAAVLYATRSRRRKKITPPWWNSELHAARKVVRATARRRITSGDRRSYNTARNIYTSLLRKSKIESWRNFCTLEGTQP